jgi:asparagine synthase (glutamine-hydrolysing)
MCGIAGFVTERAQAGDRETLRRMTDVIRHRGPDDEGFYEDDHAFLGHRRLSIIDLAAGHQPMTSESGELWITYNGEIFNHAELRVELERAGHRYRTRSDTETILHAFEEYGERFVERLRGMFAFALWHKGRRELICVRDRLGIKPFYYFWDGHLFVFASEIKAILEHPAVSPRLEESLLPEYLAFGYTSGDRTLFAGIRKLMPGHTLRLRPGAPQSALEIRRYWDVPEPDPCSPPVDEASLIRECRERIAETVRMRLMSDVPLGMFLSGGVDSSTIAALMKRMTDGPVLTFAVGYREQAYSELDYAARVARAIGTEHHEVTVGREEFFGALPKLIWHEDEPITWPSSVPLHFVSRLASRHVKVVLTGEGSDEIFGGYGRYRLYAVNRAFGRFYGLLPASLRARLREAVAASALLSSSLRRKLQHTVVGREGGLVPLYLDNFYCAFPAGEQPRLFRTPGGPEVYAEFLRYWEAGDTRSALGRLLYADQKTYLVELLMKQDQMSMACSIESRVPLLDHPLVEFSTRVPDRLKVRRGEGKYILKKAVEDLLPREIIYRRKMGFPTPLRQWLMGPESERLYSCLRDPEGLVAACTDRAELDALLERHQRGFEDATDRIWRLLNLQVWGDLFLTGRAENYAGAVWPAGAHAAEPAP